MRYTAFRLRLHHLTLCFVGREAHPLCSYLQLSDRSSFFDVTWAIYQDGTIEHFMLVRLHDLLRDEDDVD